MGLARGVDPPFDDLNTLKVCSGLSRDSRVLERVHQEAGRAARTVTSETSPHRNPELISLFDHSRRTAEVLGKLRSRKKSDDGSGPARCIGLSSPHSLKDRISRVLLGPDHGVSTRVGKEMILHIAVTGISSTEVSGVVVFFCCARGRAVGVGAANEAHHEGVRALLAFNGQPVLQHIPNHVAPGEGLDGHRCGLGREHFAVDRPQHRQVVGHDLLKVTEFIFGTDAPSRESVETAFGCGFMLYEFDQWFQSEAVFGFG